MKKHLPSLLLVGSLVLTYFSKFSIASSISVLGLSLLFGAQLYLEEKAKIIKSEDELEKIKKQVKEMKTYFSKEISSRDAKLEKIEDEMTKVSISVSRIPGASTEKKSKQSILF